MSELHTERQSKQRQGDRHGEIQEEKKYKRLDNERLPEIGRSESTFVTQRAGTIIEHIPAQPSFSLSLSQKSRELESIKHFLDQKRLSVIKRIEDLKEVREGLKVKQKQLKERVCKFEKFLIESNGKRVRALRKAVVERKFGEMKAQESIQTRLQIDSSTLENSKLLHEISEYSRYEAYLMKIVRMLPTNYFNSNDVSINDILLRHRTLIETNRDLVLQIEQNQHLLEHDIESLTRIQKEQEDTTLILNSVLGNKQKLFERMKQEKRLRAQRQEEVDRNYKEKMRMIGEIKLTIHSLFERVMVISFISNKSDALNMSRAALIGMESVEAMDHNLYSVKEKLLDLKSLSGKCVALGGKKRG